ncbi:MAG: metallophosphatase family protein [Anaerolineales bacterium]|nr:metallophosphatase family protein [Anaerolineales bacterium]MCX7755227.1 metallophosphatase family protein [Anaerolineales bacterium]MDW8277500.1 metallophosphoesterase family protein [Anaerolineales bacterium]
MRVLVISDIHANLTALEAVLADAGTVDATWCLGDVVGYGPDPNEVVERIRQIPNLTCLLGNHDVAVLGQMDYAVFNTEARRSLMWQKKALSPENAAFLESLPQETQVRENVSLAHGSPRDPVWEYILNTLVARLNFEAFQTPYCFVGHSHIQCMFRLDVERDRVSLDILRPNEIYPLQPRAILNPGSVGQPRDRDPRASYAIFDTETESWEPRRVAYDIESVQKRIRAAALPEKHAMRLSEGW